MTTAIQPDAAAPSGSPAEALADHVAAELAFVVQYRGKEMHTAPQPWRAMAAFDQQGVADRYAADCSKSNYCPWEYRVVHATPTAERIEGPSEADMRGLSASDYACHTWPEDTAEHRAARDAYIRGAIDARAVIERKPEGPAAEGRATISPELACKILRAYHDKYFHDIADLIDRQAAEIASFLQQCNILDEQYRNAQQYINAYKLLAERTAK